MQCQLEALDLPRAFYLEASFTTKYVSEEDYLADPLEEGEHKGCLVSIGPRSSLAAPLELWDDHAGQLAWAKDTVAKEGGHIVLFKLVHFNEFIVKVNAHRRGEFRYRLIGLFQRSIPWMLRVLPHLRDAFHELVRFDHAKAQQEMEQERQDRITRKELREAAKLEPATLSAADLCGNED